jgi:hypothetical protein
MVLGVSKYRSVINFYKIEEENKPKAKYSSTGVKGKASGNKTPKAFWFT